MTIDSWYYVGEGVTFFPIFSDYRWQHDVGRSYHVTGSRDLNIVLLVNNIILYTVNNHRVQQVQIASEVSE